MTTGTISVDEAEDLVYDHVAIQDVSDHRWYIKQLVVFHGDDALWGFYYLKPKTEIQEGQDRFESDPVRTFPVVAEEVRVTKYKPKEQA
jgi:hypothetical protein